MEFLEPTITVRDKGVVPLELPTVSLSPAGSETKTR